MIPPNAGSVNPTTTITQIVKQEPGQMITGDVNRHAVSDGQTSYHQQQTNFHQQTSLAHQPRQCVMTATDTKWEYPNEIMSFTGQPVYNQLPPPPQIPLLLAG